MPKYLKLFENLDSFEASEDKSLKNHLIEDIELKEDPYRGHPYVEIGGKKWATMNIGATEITDNGLYFAWGETKGYKAEQVGSGPGQKYFDYSDYELCEGSSHTMKRYFRPGDTLRPEDDAAVVNWGGVWRMPSSAECAALQDATEFSYTNNYQGTGVSGYILTDKTDSTKELFFPSAGWCHSGTADTWNGGSHCWNNTLNSGNYSQYATMMYFSLWQNPHFNDFNSRAQGLTVRAIAEW